MLKTTRTKTLFILVSITSFIALSFLGKMIWFPNHEKPPQFFSFDDPDATYTVTRHGDHYMLKYKSTGDIVDNEIETMIGRSKVELEPLLGKPVAIDGDFVYSDEQCVANKCHHIGSWAVLNIDKIEKITN